MLSNWASVSASTKCRQQLFNLNSLLDKTVTRNKEIYFDWQKSKVHDWHFSPTNLLTGRVGARDAAYSYKRRGGRISGILRIVSHVLVQYGHSIIINSILQLSTGKDWLRSFPVIEGITKDERLKGGGNNTKVYLLAPSGALVFIMSYYIQPSFSNLEQSCLYTFIFTWTFIQCSIYRTEPGNTFA